MQLLLPSSKSVVLVKDKPHVKHHIERVLFVFGILVVLLGILDVFARIPQITLGDDVLRQAFTPAVLMGN